MDEFDLDVTDLREPADVDDGDLVFFATRPTSRHPFGLHTLVRLPRRVRGVLAGAVVLLVAAVVLLNIPQAPATLAALLRIPTPTPPPPLAVGADTLVLRHAVPWGELRLDGAPVQHLGTALVPPNTQGAELPALTVTRGTHSLSYVAPPFSPLRCTISVPAAPTDTCPLGPHDEVGALETFGAARIVDLGATPALLPPAQHQALVSSVATALAAQSPTATLAAGELYLGADGRPTLARAPLMATLRYTLDTTEDIIGPTADGVCLPLCADAHDQGDLSSWLLAARLALAWQYAPSSAAGRPFRGDVAPGPPTAIYVDVQVTWDGIWRVVSAPIDGQAECAVATASAQAVLAQHRLSGRLSCVSAPDHIAAGCLVMAQPLDSTGQPVGSELALYYRFGVLFAGEVAARRALPELPALPPAVLTLLPAP